jgi:NADPH:quinone reductase-like Zn-dependent oxidoreductase
MKALQINGYGKIENNLTFAEISLPELKDNQLLVEIHSAGVNPVEYKLAEGQLQDFKQIEFPSPIGFDVAGVVTKVGKDVIDFQVGDRVFSRVSENSPGTFAEFVAVDSSVVSKIPKNLTFAEASSIPLVGLTSIQAFQKANLREGDRVLIHAGSGGVGTFAIQYAKAKGAYVYTTTSTENVQWVKTLGADRVIDYKTENYLDIAKEIDIVFDTLGGDYLIDSFKTLKQGGELISIVGSFDADTNFRISNEAKMKSANYEFFIMGPNGAQLREIKDLVENDLIRPVIDREFDFSDAIEALHYQKLGRAKGKVVLNMR